LYLAAPHGGNQKANIRVYKAPPGFHNRREQAGVFAATGMVIDSAADTPGAERDRILGGSRFLFPN
jgi:hypothetical protein